MKLVRVARTNKDGEQVVVVREKPSEMTCRDMDCRKCPLAHKWARGACKQVKFESKLESAFDILADLNEYGIISDECFKNIVKQLHTNCEFEMPREVFEGKRKYFDKPTDQDYKENNYKYDYNKE